MFCDRLSFCRQLKVVVIKFILTHVQWASSAICMVADGESKLPLIYIYIYIYIYTYIQCVPGGMCETSGECSVC